MKQIFIVLLVLAWFLQPGPAKAQLSLEGWEGELEGRGEYTRDDVESEADERTFQNLRFSEILRLRNKGFIYHPGLLTFSAGTAIGLSQEMPSSDGESRSNYGRVLGYDLGLHFLSAKPYNLSLFGSRGSGTVSHEQGRTETLSESLGGRLSYWNHVFPLRLDLRRDHREDEFRFFGVPVRHDELKDSLSLSGNNTWDNHYLDLDYDLIDLEDRIFPTLSVTTHSGRAYYRYLFGDWRDNAFTSSTSFFNREGLSNFTQANSNQILRMTHSDTLTTQYGYAFNYASAAEATTILHQGDFSLGYQPYANLGGEFKLSGGISSFPQGEQKFLSSSLSAQHDLYDSLSTGLALRGGLSFLPEGVQENYGAGVNLGYRRKLPYNGRLIGGFGLDYDTLSQVEQEGLVLQERHTAELASPFRLERPLAIRESVVVTDVTQAIIYQEGLDYLLQPFGDFLEVLVLFGGRIIDGQPILVSYRFVPSPSLTYATTRLRANLGLDYGWVYPYYSHDQVSPRLISGRDASFLERRQSDTAGIRFLWNWPKVRLSLLNEYQRIDARRLAYNALVFSQSFWYSPIRTVTWSLNFGQSVIDYTLPRRESESYRGQTNLAWSPELPFRLTIEGFGGFNILKSETSSEWYHVGSRARASWTYGKIEIIPLLEYTVRSLQSTLSREFFASLRVIRRF
ncbi:MAG: hypothetical protein HY695_34435 [Deltaproteobacteria bacterium]|nr:hypothetical protein [Deltaproteobacteria bacterium]